MIGYEKNTATVLEINPKNFPKLWMVHQAHPEIVDVFQNIRADRELFKDIVFQECLSSEMHSIYIKHVFMPILQNIILPVLEECKIIVKNPQQKCGFDALYDRLSFVGWNNHKEQACITSTYANMISKGFNEHEQNEDIIASFLTGIVDPRISREFFTDLKKLIRKHSQLADTKEPVGASWRLAIVGKVFS